MGKLSRAICFLAAVGASVGAPAAEAQGPWGPAVKLCCTDAGNPRLAMNTLGGAAIAWNAGGSIHVILRPPGGGFGEPWEVGRTVGSDPPYVAISDTGDVAVAWVLREGQNAIEVRGAVRRGTGRFGPAQTLPLGSPIALAIDPAGTAVVVGKNLPGESPERMLAVWSFPNEQSFGQPQDVSGATGLPTGSPQVAFAGPQAVVAWTGAEAGSDPTRRMLAAFGTPAGFGPPQRVSEFGSGMAGADPVIAASKNGEAALMWGGGFAARYALVAYRHPGSGFSPPQQLWDRAGIDPSVALGPAGRAVASWNGFPAPEAQAAERSPIDSRMAVLDAGDAAFKPFPVPGILHRRGHVAFDGLGTAVAVGNREDVDGMFSWARLPDGSFGGFDRLPGSSSAAIVTAFDALGGGLAVWVPRPPGDNTLTYRPATPPNDTSGPIYASAYDGKVILARMLPPVVEYIYPIGARVRSSARRARAPRGIRFGLSKPAKVRITVQLLRRKARRPKRIAVDVRGRRIGANTVRFSRRTRSKLRRRGRYRIVVQGRDDKGQLGRPRSMRFRVGKTARRRPSRS